jgi:hypothetical protein
MSKERSMAFNWEEWKRVQHSMELEGWMIPEEKLLEVAKEYEASGVESLAQKIALVAEESGRPLAEVAEEVLKAFRERYNR